MIILKSPNEIEVMKIAGRITANALALAGSLIRPGMTTKELDTKIHDYIVKNNATPSFLHYNGFAGSACISINEEVIHGIPSGKVIREGDIVSVDVGACYKGFHGDCADTFFVGPVSEEARKLVKVTRQSFYEGLKAATAQHRLSDISHAVQIYCESFGYGVVREYTGHGIGRHLHEDPNIPNYGNPGRGVRLMAGMTIAVEPMVNAGTPDIINLNDGWTVVTADGSLSAHYENTILITDGEPVILTVAG